MTAKHSSLVCWPLEAGAGVGPADEAGAAADAWSDDGDPSSSLCSLKASMVMRRSTWGGLLKILDTDRQRIDSII